MHKEEAERIEKESDLLVPVAAIKEKEPTDQEDQGFIQKFGGVIVGGLISGSIFFGLGKFLDWFGIPTEDEQTEDQV